MPYRPRSSCCCGFIGSDRSFSSAPSTVSRGRPDIPSPFAKSPWLMVEKFSLPRFLGLLLVCSSLAFATAAAPPPPLPVATPPAIDQTPVVLVYPFDVQTGADPRIGMAIAQILAQEMTAAGGITVPPVPQGVKRADFLDNARTAKADFYISGYVTPVGDSGGGRRAGRQCRKRRHSLLANRSGRERRRRCLTVAARAVANLDVPRARNAKRRNAALEHSRSKLHERRKGADSRARKHC